MTALAQYPTKDSFTILLKSIYGNLLLKSRFLKRWKTVKKTNKKKHDEFFLIAKAKNGGITKLRRLFFNSVFQKKSPS